MLKEVKSSGRYIEKVDWDLIGRVLATKAKQRLEPLAESSTELLRTTST